ncbi:MAG: PAS domain S-box protein [Syntrophomonadaceae bacterium]|nr:PAS domain S-box protein [Syntrophomonadaceae bacterium]
MKNMDKTKEQLIEEINEMRLKLQIEIDSRKQAEAALRQSEEKFSKAFLFGPDTFIISNLSKGCYVDVNDAFLKATGYTREEVIGHSSESLGIWADPEDKGRIFTQVKERGSVRNIEINFRMKSGEIITTLLSATIIDICGEEHLIFMIKNINEHKRMEDALRLSEERFSKAFNVSPIPMTITTFEEGRFLDSNDSFNDMYGSSREKLQDKTSLDVFWLDSDARNLVTQRLLENGSIRNMEITFKNKTGEKRSALYSAELLNVMGTRCILSIFSDITELRRMEVEIARLDRLNLVGEMAASIGHEIRNPMTTVRGYLQMLRENVDYKREAEQFDLMIEELDRANSIITEFLSLAKNKMVKLRPENLTSIIMKLLPLIQTRAISQNHYIKLELIDLPDLLLDKEEIHQLIFNLVNNALESMSSAGNVTIRTLIENGEVVLAVQDEGHEIDGELLDKLGTPFLTTKEQGTGLGLAVCYRIAARHNAKIDIETSPTGTTFYVRFPIPTNAIITMVS